MRFELLCSGCHQVGGDCERVRCSNGGCDVEVLSCLAFASHDGSEQPYCSMACITDERLAREDAAFESRRAS